MKAEDRFIQAAKAVKQTLADMESEHHFSLTFKAEGRIHDGELKITISIGEYGSEVEGNDLTRIITEYKRRKGWDVANAPLCLPNVEYAQ